MKKLLIILTLAATFGSCSKDEDLNTTPKKVWSGSMIINKFNGLDSLQKFLDGEYTEIESNLIFYGVDNEDEYYLSFLTNLTSIGGNFNFELTSTAKNFTGLNNLEEIGGKFSVKDNDVLENFSGLESLNKIGNGFYINECEFIKSFSGLESLEEISGDMNFDGTSVENFKSLEQLRIVNGDVLIRGTTIKSLEGLNNLSEVGDFYIRNTSISNLEGLNNLSTVVDFMVQYCDSLLDLSGFGITTAEIISFSYCDQLSSLSSSMSSLNSHNNTMKQISISNNAILDNYEGLSYDLLNSLNDLQFVCYNNKYNPTLVDLIEGRYTDE